MRHDVRCFATLALVVTLWIGLVAACHIDDGESPTEGAKMIPKTSVVFWELGTTDMEKSADFFKKVFEWDVKFNKDIGFYEVPIAENARPFSGGYIYTPTKANLHFLTIYIAVTDIEAKAEKIKECGGAITEPPHEMPGGYWICLFNEPSGVTFAMIQPGKPKETEPEKGTAQ